MISTANITMQFGAKPLFENVSVKFNNGNRYGLIGANGCGKSTFMKILGGDLEPSGGQVMLEPNVRLGKLRQDQFAYEDFNVIDTVIMGHEALWKVKAERDRIYSLPEMSEADGMAVAELETEFAEMDGYTAMREIRNRPEWRRLPIIALTAKAMKDDQEKCLAAGANDYIAKPLDVEKLLSLVRVWMPK